MSLVPCDLHELTNCSVCTGVDKKFQASLESDLPDPDAPLPRIPDGVTIHSKFAGTCHCGQWYPEGSVIHRPSDNSTGWLLVGCCVMVP